MKTCNSAISKMQSYCIFGLRKVAFVLIISALLFTGRNLCCFAADDEIASGTCGDGITWSLSNDYVLTISGEGKPASQSSTSQPWSNYQKRIKAVIIEDGITEISSGLFWSCSAIETVTLPDSVSSIGSWAFSSCEKLSSIDLSKINSIGDEVFSGCKSLESIEFPDSVNSLGYNMLSGCINLTEVHFPENVTSIGFGFFNQCINLKTIDLPAELTSIPEYTFFRCTGLETVRIPSKVTNIDQYAFKDCSSLTDVYVPDSVSSIDNNGFAGTSAVINCTDTNSYAYSYAISKNRRYDLASGHQIDNGDLVKEPNCIEPGIIRYYCATCKRAISEEEVPELGHDISHYVEKAATCTEDGWNAYDECSRCEYTTYEKINRLGHDLTHHDAKAVTCNEDGHNAYDECSRCDYSTIVINSKLGHDWGTWQILSNPTCNSVGIRARFCNRCNEEDRLEISKIDHTWKTSYTVDKKATYAANGSKSIHCSVCNAKKPGSTVSIPKLTVNATTISKVTPYSKAFTVKWKKGSGINGYQIQYATNSKFTTGKKTITITKASTISKKITKLKAKKKYWVRIRTYKTVSGKKYYSAWSKAKAVTTKK